MRSRCPLCGSPIIKATLLGGEIERECFAAAHPYLTPSEIAERDRFLVRVTASSGRAAHPPVWREVG